MVSAIQMPVTMPNQDGREWGENDGMPNRINPSLPPGMIEAPAPMRPPAPSRRRAERPRTRRMRKLPRSTADATIASIAAPDTSQSVAGCPHGATSAAPEAQIAVEVHD